ALARRGGPNLAGFAVGHPTPSSPSAAGASRLCRRGAASSLVLGAQLKDLALPKDRAGRTVVNAGAVLRVLRTHRSRAVTEASEEGIPHGEIDFATGLVHLDGARWLTVEDEVPASAVTRDARILADYLDSFRSFLGNAAGAVEVYWAFLVWLYSASAAPICARPRCRTALIPGSTRSMPCCLVARAAARRCSPKLPRADVWLR